MDIRPFRAWRYHPVRAGRLEALIAPLSEREQVSPLLYRTFEHSVHLAAPRSLEQAADRWHRWRQQGIVRQDVLPALYAHSQTFTREGVATPLERIGLIALVRLNDPAEARDDIRPHEAVRPANVQALAQLLARTRTAVSPAFGLYADPRQQVEPLLAAALSMPLLDVTDDQGVRHRLAPLQQLAEIEAVRQALAPVPVLLADGHHRVAAAEAYRDRLRQAGAPLPAHSLARYTLFYLSNAYAPAEPNPNAIQPMHRVVNLPRGLSEAEAVQRLDPFFTLQAMDKRMPLAQEVARLPGGQGQFVLLARGARQRLVLRPEVARQPVPLPLDPSVKGLDATLLHYWALDQAFGIPYAQHPTDPRLSYHRALAPALEAAGQPDHVGFLLAGVPLSQFQAVTDAGARMPAKTTYFAPKVLSGLVYASLDEQAAQTPFDGLVFPPAAPVPPRHG